ncbi:hypothetical protein EW145_g8477, partial [Phellinidium pouzarii]
KYRAHKEKLRALKSAAASKGATRAEQYAIERKLMKEFEAAGIAAEKAAEERTPW